MQNSKKKFSDRHKKNTGMKSLNGPGAFGLCICAMLLSLILQLAAVIIVMILPGLSVSAQVSWSVLVYQLLMPAVYGLWYYFECGKPEFVRPDSILNARCVGTTALASFGLCVFAYGILMLFMFFTPNLYDGYEVMMDDAGMGENLMTIVASVILAPLGEELLCRGVIFRYCRSMTRALGNARAQFWVANIIQALLFGVLHGNLIQGTYAFVLGLGLGLLCERYHSIYPSMLCHFLINFLSMSVMGILLIFLPMTLFGAVGLLLVGAVLCMIAYSLMYPAEKENGSV